MGISWAFMNNPIVRWFAIVGGVLLGLKFYGEKREADGRRQERAKGQRETRKVINTIQENSDDFVKTYKDAVDASPHYPAADSVPEQIASVIFKPDSGNPADHDGGSVRSAETEASNSRRIRRYVRGRPRESD